MLWFWPKCCFQISGPGVRGPLLYKKCRTCTNFTTYSFIPQGVLPLGSTRIWKNKLFNSDLTVMSPNQSQLPHNRLQKFGCLLDTPHRPTRHCNDIAMTRMFFLISHKKLKTPYDRHDTAMTRNDTHFWKQTCGNQRQMHILLWIPHHLLVKKKKK